MDVERATLDVMYKDAGRSIRVVTPSADTEELTVTPPRDLP